MRGSKKEKFFFIESRIKFDACKWKVPVILDSAPYFYLEKCPTA